MTGRLVTNAYQKGTPLVGRPSFLPVDDESWPTGILEPILVFLLLGIIAVMVGLF